MSVVAPTKPANTIAGLPRDLWTQILTYIDDQRDLFRVARVSRALHTIARDALKRHTFRLETTNAITAFSAALTNRPALASSIQHLYIRCADERIPSCLPVTFRTLRELRSLALHVDDPALALACAQRALFNEPLPHLATFSTSLPCTIEVLDFIQTHGSIEDLSITDGAIDPTAFGPTLPLPSLRALTCRMEFLQCFHRSPTLTHLYITLHVEGSLDALARLLGPQLVSLQLGLRKRPISNRTSTSISAIASAWSPSDVSTRFPRLRYFQLRVLEPPDVRSSSSSFIYLSLVQLFLLSVLTPCARNSLKPAWRSGPTLSTGRSRLAVPSVRAPSRPALALSSRSCSISSTRASCRLRARLGNTSSAYCGSVRRMSREYCMVSMGGRIRRASCVQHTEKARGRMLRRGARLGKGTGRRCRVSMPRLRRARGRQ